MKKFLATALLFLNVFGITTVVTAGSSAYAASSDCPGPKNVIKVHYHQGEKAKHPVIVCYSYRQFDGDTPTRYLVSIVNNTNARGYVRSFWSNGVFKNEQVLPAHKETIIKSDMRGDRSWFACLRKPPAGSGFPPCTKGQNL
jgi:hypothetical protein